jgi:hypothetical protein
VKYKLLPLATALLLFFLAEILGAVEKTPRLSMLKTKFDAGKIVPGALISHSFLIKNTGQANLEIIQVVPGCGCTAVNFDKVITPGETGWVTLKVEFYAEWAGRSLNQTILMETNDPQAKYTSLTISAEVLPDNITTAPVATKTVAP